MNSGTWIERQKRGKKWIEFRGPEGTPRATIWYAGGWFHWRISGRSVHDAVSEQEARRCILARLGMNGSVAT